jgi:carbonic anhydrase
MKTKNIINFFAIAMALGVSASVIAADAPKARAAEWGYEGSMVPERWGQLHPSYKTCSDGKQQSPINIKTIELDRRANIRFDYTPVSVDISNDAAAAGKADAKRITRSDNGRTVQLYFNDSSEKEAVVLDGVSYRLIDEHFHKPSEHLLAGQRFPLEIHFVHENDKGQLLVVGVFIQAGKRENAGLKEILKAFETAGKAKPGKAVLSRVTLNPSWMFPGKQSYFEYSGSLTTPPCAEGVRWLVMAVPVEASLEQIGQLEKLLSVANSRPIQSLNGREVKEFLSEAG